ncbi:LLM class F420-dependent oxidoreductase [Mycobacteroides chelonae]|uniref:LLM class F420-dependent oxidoreductase n=1 Tax=Mycobacteroides chelonae TaxID=1774 RepID=UPI0007A0F37D|nr:LLM class F420-dependent oxidoreductase [Mycobacteroides chelonae]AMW22328.1 luciferase [Mycobacterium sp. QIA-37]AYM44306.1 LLM class F420-dependent oxidoreductase [[Mycobacterium] chelonae subsp. gwanakae]OHU15648.1 LLM class F420-dependent oxidoreductase [Mycobacteroides chelonae]
MRFDIKTANHNTTWSEIRAMWKEADGIEIFHTGWLFDHFYPIASPSQQVPDLDGPCLEGWMLLAALARETSRLRLGTLVTGIHYRHPAVLANMVATADIVSGGRLELGLGAGWNEQESDAYGIELGSLTQRFDRFDEACQVIISLLSRPVTNFTGDYYSVTDAHCEPKSLQRPHPPILIGGKGEKRTLPLVARYAQHWNFPSGTPDEFAYKRKVLHAHCTELGRDPSEIMTSAHVWLKSGASKDISRLIEEIAEFGAAGLDAAVIYLPLPLDAGVLTPLAEQLAAIA